MKELIIQPTNDSRSLGKKDQRKILAPRELYKKKERNIENTKELKEHRECQAEQERKGAEKTLLALKKKAREGEISREEQARLETEYINLHLPNYLKRQQGAPLAFGAVSFFFKVKEAFGLFRVRGRERIPQSGPYLVVSPHFGGETGKLLYVFGGRKVHIMAGTESNWNRSKSRKKLLEGLGMLKVDESLAQLSDQQKQELFTRVPNRSRGAYERIIENEKNGRVAANVENVRAAVAALLCGEPVAIFPEGLFTYDGKRQLRKAYLGLELICDEYKRLTGRDLPLLPVAVRKNEVVIGEASILPEKAQEKQRTDWIMKKLASLLPARERGVYT